MSQLTLIQKPSVLMLLVACLVAGCVGESIPQVEGIEVTLDNDNFEMEALQSSVPVLVEFGAEWCGPCRQMEPALAYLSVEYDGRLKVGKVDVDRSSEIASTYEIDGYPTFVILRDGAEIARDSGSMSYQMLSSWVDSHIAE